MKSQFPVVCKNVEYLEETRRKAVRSTVRGQGEGSEGKVGGQGP